MQEFANRSRRTTLLKWQAFCGANCTSVNARTNTAATLGGHTDATQAPAPETQSSGDTQSQWAEKGPPREGRAEADRGQAGRCASLLALVQPMREMQSFTAAGML